MKQVITISPAGEISGLQRKPGQGIDLRLFGKAEIVRASEIVWNQLDQLWEIEIMTGPFAGQRVTGRLWRDSSLAFQEALDHGAGVVERDRPIQFTEYDQAVAAEIAVLDAFRIKGLF